MEDIEKRNLVSTIKKCLQEHQVDLAGDDERVPMYLIEIAAQSILFKDFTDTYQEELDGFKKNIALKMFGSKEEIQTYGVLVG